MKKWSKSFIIKCLSITSGKQYICESLTYCSEKTGVSKYILTRIKEGEHSSFVTSVLKGKEVMWQIQFFPKQACTLYPAWDSMYDAERVNPQEFASHEAAIKRLSGGTMQKESTYYRRLREHLAKGGKLGEPCSKTIKDVLGYEWIIVFHKEKGKFIPNKKKGES